MQTHLAEAFRDTPEGQEAEAILRACVHCGFCTATCPTYQILGDELDGPRGRIYLIKQVLEGATPTRETQTHLDRCLTCRACETTCPSGVQYGRLVDIGRAVVEEAVGRDPASRLARALVHRGLLAKPLFDTALRIGRALRPVLPASLKAKVPPLRDPGAWPEPRHTRRVLLLDSCVQTSLAPVIDAAAARVLDRIGLSLVWVPAGGCCGALSHHMNEHERASAIVKANIDAWWPEIERGAEAVVSSASGCSVMLKDYGHFLRHDPDYRERAERIAALARDLSELVFDEWPRLAPLLPSEPEEPEEIAYHPPCTLQHGMKRRGQVEQMLAQAGFKLLPVADAHLCCGSAGTYSIFQPGLSAELKRRKLAALEAEGPRRIVTANIGCLTHLASGTRRPVQHWIELLDERLA
ncbi:MAG: glycolate oxidase subunit GlcF [Casimicrobiaceae bacterium]|nr:glycolate oxidase subunit GlcF [Casimicrobiaceae bacterium]MDW8311675.1 glycolate oxidase subunit GlcF [Burkholderiales bacterium]